MKWMKIKLDETVWIKEWLERHNSISSFASHWKNTFFIPNKGFDFFKKTDLNEDLNLH